VQLTSIQMKILTTFFVIVLMSIEILAQKQTALSNQSTVHPTTIKTPVGFSVSKPLRNAPIDSSIINIGSEFYLNKHRDRELNPKIFPPDFTNMPSDPGEQTIMGSISSGRGLDYNYAGQNSGSYPPDCNGTVNSTYYFQVVNTTYQIFNKSDGSTAAGPSNLNTIFNSSLPGASCNSGDPIVLWDEQANRWLFAEFSLCGSNDYMLIAVSTSDDPTGTWYSWSFDVDNTPDYMKFGIWEDGYYMATNTSPGNDVYVFERSEMITGGSSPTMIGFDNPNRPTTFDGFHCLLPLDNDGPWSPSGTPGQFITIADDGQSNAADELRIYELNADWTVPANSTFTMTQQLLVNSFSGNFSGDWDNIPQPGSSQKLDGISTVLMYRAQYRNFGGTQKLVCTHAIAESATESAIRWYEIERTTGNWSISQQGTYNPDGVSRWNSSIAMNDIGEIGMGYSVSDGTSTYPGIRYCGQSSSGPTGVMDIAEVTIWSGTNSQSDANRWGDYSNISIDPSDGATFWYTNEYQGVSSHGTRIAAFSFPPTCSAPTTQVSNFNQVSATTNTMNISWDRGNGDALLIVAKASSSVNSNPVSSNSYTANNAFGSGTELGTGNFVVYDGTGTTATISNLLSGSTYYFSFYEYFDVDNCYLTPAYEGYSSTTGTAPCIYCSSSGNTDYETSTTYVGYNTILNASTKPSGYSDYTTLITDIEIGGDYQLNVRANTDGNYITNTIAWIDWNQDCDYDDVNEEFDLGEASNVADGLTDLSPLTINVPVDALLGNTMLRVSTKYGSDPISCETGFDGEVEDYTINLIPANTTWSGYNTNWSDPSNWPNGILPNSSYEVSIPAIPIGGSFPEISAVTNAKCYSITLEPGATITIYGNLEVEN